MLVWLIQTGEPLPLNSSVKKMRTALLADELIKRGHSVTWWASSFDHQKKIKVCEGDKEIVTNNGIKIIPLDGGGYKKNISLQRFIDHRIVARKFSRFAAKKEKPDIIVTSMPPHDIAYKAVMLAKKNNIPVVADIRDEWPDLFVNSAPAAVRPLVKKILVWDFSMIKKTMSGADSLVAMMNSLLKWGLDYAGRKQSQNDKVFYLGGNKIDKTIKNSAMNFSESLKGKFVVSFIGTFVENNNPSVLVECAKLLSEKNIHFVLAGDGELLNEVKERAKGLNNISLPGWLNQEQINSLLLSSNAGIAPAKQNRDAFPNKIFTYFSAGIPVITSFQGELKEIIEKNNIGMYYTANNIHELANCILKLYENRVLCELMSDNSVKLFNDMFDAEKIYSNYADHIEMIYKKFQNK